MKELKNRRLVLLLVIVVLLVAVIGVTFAYFMSNNQVINALNVTTNIENNNGVFTAIGSNIELNVTRDAMSEAVNNNLATSANGTLNVEYLSGSTNGIVCQYDINYVWESDNDTNPYTITNESKNEFTFDVIEGEDVIINERNFVASSNRNVQKLGTGYIYNDSATNPTTKTYEINAKFYNLEEEQNHNAGKNWVIRFYVDNVVCGSNVDSTYTLSGVLLDDNGQPIPNATVLTHSEVRYATTDSNGAFTITGLEEGNHEIYFVPNKTILEVSQMSDAQIQALPDVKSGTFTTSSENTITMSGNYSIGSMNIEEKDVRSSNVLDASNVEVNYNGNTTTLDRALDDLRSKM